VKPLRAEKRPRARKKFPPKQSRLLPQKAKLLAKWLRRRQKIPRLLKQLKKLPLKQKRQQKP